jgi:hypothetical protein
MDFDWSSFGTGFAKAASENFAKEEEDAKALGAANVKSMYENYASVVKENRTLSNDIKEKINIVKGFAPDASDDQLVALAQDRGILDMLTTRLKDKDFDPTGFDINNFVKVAKSDSPYKAEDRINQLFTIPSAVNDASRAFKSLTPEGEVKESPGFLSYFDPVDLAKRGGEKQAKISAEKTAAALGVPLEKLQGAMGYKRDMKPSGAEYSLVELKPGETMEQMRDRAGVAYARALKKGNPDEIKLAEATVFNANKAKDLLSDDQTQWANNIARLKGLQIKGTPAQKEAATNELNAIFAEEKKATAAKQQPKEERDNLIAKNEMDAVSEDPEKSKAAIAFLLRDAGITSKITEAKQTKTQQRDNYLADLDMKAKNGTPAEQETAKAKLIDIAKLDKIIADNKLGDVQKREAYLARLKDQAKDPDLAIATPALAELKLVSAIDATIKEAGNTSVEKLAATKAQLVIDTANGDKDAEAKLQAFFAVEKMEADAKQGAAAQRTSLIAQLKMDVAAGKPGAKEELDRQEAVDIAAKKAEKDALQGDAERRTNKLAKLQTDAAAGVPGAQAEFNKEKAIDDAAKLAEQNLLMGDAQKRTNRLAELNTIITTDPDPAKRKAAKLQMDKELKLMREEAQAKQVPKDASDKVPSLGALNAFTASAVGLAVSTKHGNLGKDMAIVDKVGEGGVTYKEYEYIGDDPALRQQIADTKAAAAKRALSVYMDNNGLPLDRNVQAVLNVYTGSSPRPAKAGGLGSRPAAEAAPAPAPAAAAAAPAAASFPTKTEGNGAGTVVTVTDPAGTPHVFRGANAAAQAEGFKAAAKSALAAGKK